MNYSLQQVYLKLKYQVVALFVDSISPLVLDAQRKDPDDMQFLIFFELDLRDKSHEYLQADYHSII